MRLKLLDLIDETIVYLNDKYDSIKIAQGSIINLFNDHLIDIDYFLGIISRIKSEDSLKEKIIRNKIYKEYNTGADIIDFLSDLIGINIQCRFINEEKYIYQHICNMFNIDDNKEYVSCKYLDNLYLNLKMEQPQRQNNGFNIYRIDGYYILNGFKINYEIQIKSLIDNFWSDIEHQVVYKNNYLVYADDFMKEILSSINTNLITVDHQLEIVYQQILKQSNNNTKTGMTQQGFKLFLSKSINDLYTLKMNESMGFTTNFKNVCGILSQYIYVKDFINNNHNINHNDNIMMKYIDQFNKLKDLNIDFTKEIKLESKYNNDCIFLNIIGSYWESIINDDFQWYCFFKMLFIIEPGNNIQDFSNFINVIKDLIVPNKIFINRFYNLSVQQQLYIKNKLLHSLATQMVNYGKINMIYENILNKLQIEFKDTIDTLDGSINNFDKFKELENEIINSFNCRIIKCLD